ncbi:MAG: hypothetical protein ACAI38_23775 [Myxococcota bacterium]
MANLGENQPGAIGTHVDIVALGRRAISLVLSDPLVHIGAGVLLVAGSVVSLTILTAPLLIGYIRMVRRALAGEPIDFQHLGLGFDRPAAAILAWLVYGLGVLILMVAFVLPGVLLAIACMFAFWYLALTDDLAAQSLKNALALTRRAPGVVLVVALVAVLVNLVGLLTFVGALITVPLTLTFLTLCFNALEPRSTS